MRGNLPPCELEVSWKHAYWGSSSISVTGQSRRFELGTATSGLRLSTDVLGIGQKVSNGPKAEGDLISRSEKPNLQTDSANRAALRPVCFTRSLCAAPQSACGEAHKAFNNVSDGQDQD
jgi:hypothetical protein